MANDAVKCVMCNSENMAIVWTEQRAVRPYIRSGTIRADAGSHEFEPEVLDDEKLMCFDCGHDKEKVKVEWE